MSDEAAKPISISYNFIAKGQVDSLFTAIDSVYGALYREGDECIVVDTGSSRRALKKMRNKLSSFPNLTIYEHPELCKSYEDVIRAELGEEVLAEYLGHQNGKAEGLLDFSEPRNLAMGYSTKELIFWMDSDDVLAEVEPGALRKVVDERFSSGQIDALFLDYEYAFDTDGTCITHQRRERFMRREKFYWKGRCHEVCIPIEGEDVKPIALVQDLQSVIRHTDARKPHKISDTRNYVILSDALREEEEGPEDVDPRTIFYLGNACRGMELFDRARKLYERFDRLSGSEDDRFAAKYYIAGMYLHPHWNRPVDAYTMYLDCIRIKPMDPRGYYGLQQTCMLLSRWEEAMHWFWVGQHYKMPETQVMSYDPTAVGFRPLYLATLALKELMDSNSVQQMAERMIQSRPNDKTTQELYKAFKGWALGHEISASIHGLVRRVSGPHQQHIAEAVTRALPTVPETMESLGMGKTEPPDPRTDKPSVAIFCGKTGEAWGPSARESGMGGSEKMVLMLSRAMQATGKCNVSVYAEVNEPERGVDADNVAWYHWSQFDQTRERAAMVYWRNANAVVKLRCPAKFRFLWNHDVQNPETYSEDVLAVVDKVQFQSEFHTLPVTDVVPEEQRWVARNAVEKLTDAVVPRDKKRVLFCSSPDRGLITAARIVKRAQEIDPEVELVVTYGVTPWARKAYADRKHRGIPDMGRDMSGDLYEQETFALLDEINAAVLGRVGFQEMEVLQKNCGSWLYPTRFDEISCMSAMEAQVHGCVPVSTRHGALAETIFEGPALPPLPPAGEASDEYIDEAAKILLDSFATTDEEREAMAEEAWKRFNVADLADEWLETMGLSSPAAEE